MIIFTTADWHIDNNKEFFKSLEFFVNQVEQNKPGLVTIAGDLFDKAQLNTETSGFVEVQKQILKILNVCPIAAIYGTPSHDIAGSLEIFKNLKAEFPFKILIPGEWYNYNVSSKETSCVTNDYIQITGIPEINKAFYLTEDENATPEEINKALDKFLLGLKINKKKNLPSIVLFHGEIKGAKLNENQILPGGNIELTENALLTLDADYYSCGHIHMRQDINDKMRYEGSIYPKTWGERTEKAFTVIEIDLDKKLELSEVKFPTQPMEKIKVTDVSEALYSKDILPANTKLWCEVQVLEEDYKRMTKEEISEDFEQLMSYGFGEGSRVTYTIVKNETTRASEIVETRSLYEKFMIWANNSNIDMDGIDINAIEDYCKKYESNLQELGIFNEQRALALKSLSLRGSIGIWKGMNKELYEIDLMALDSGIVALLGDNGSGKSTIIKNCNPYPDPIDGGQGLKNMFFLKDSHSVTVWEDRANGCDYKCIKKINAASGKSDFFVMVDKGNDWEPYNKDQNGRKEPYKKAILEIFGSDEIFRRSVYIAQKGSSLPQSVVERKALFNELLGNQYLEKIHEMVKTDINVVYEDIEKVSNKLEVLEEVIIDTVGTESSIRAESKVLDETEENIKILNKTILEHKKKYKYYLGIKDKMHEEKILLNGCEKDISQFQTEHDEKSLLVVDLKQLIEKEPHIRLAIDDQKTLIEREKKAIDEIVAIEAIFKKNQEECQTLKNDMSEIERKYLNESNDFTLKISNCSKYIETSKKENIELKSKIKTATENESCEKCGHIPSNVEKRIIEYGEYITSNESVISVNQTTLALLRTDFSKMQNDYKTAADRFANKINLLLKTIENLKTQKADLRNMEQTILAKKLSENEYQSYRDKLNMLVSAKENIEEHKKRLLILKSDLAEFADSLKSHNAKIEFMTKELELLNETEQQINSITEELIKNEKSISTLKSNIENHKANILRNQENVDKIKQFKETKEKLKLIFKIHSIIKSGTSKDGIQALELDALTPAILDIANKLLTSIYGDKFSLSIETIRETTKGEQVEDFEIVVTDNEEQNFDIKTQKLSTLSGGEEVWILKSIYDAFAIVGEKNTGLKYLTTFQDEADGALSPDKKHLYLRMIEASHNETNRYHTIYVTHDQGIQELIKEKIMIGVE